ncbi:hypothetical protein QEZ52_07930 [Aliisedimentitalea scapharcae]|uniref:Uncharacterized protein n=1 Tax=Aliisedimentitalea scapharcae TaxID=1524259 RepID=A0ABZ2XWH9_9RHOB
MSKLPKKIDFLLRNTLTVTSDSEHCEDDNIAVGRPLHCQDCDIDDNCIGERWVPDNYDELAALIAIVAMGQAIQASHILRELAPAEPAYSFDELRAEAKVKLTVQDTPEKPRTGYPKWQRDGFVFEVISWIAAKITYGDQALLKNPHVSATSQGLDGLMLQLNGEQDAVVSSTVFEDKCTDDPRNTFLAKVVPGFLDRHQNLRSAEIIDAAGALLRIAGLAEKDAAHLSAAVTEIAKRKYRAAFSLPPDFDTLAARQSLFSDYDRIQSITAEQRIGASFITPIDMRDWIAELADKAIEYLENLDGEEA